MLDRRSFLRGLATLPLIGGSVAILGRPTAAAVPVTPELLNGYKWWLHTEHRMLCYEMTGFDEARAKEAERAFYTDHPAVDWHFQWSNPDGWMAGWNDASQPSSRAAVVLSAVGCPL